MWGWEFCGRGKEVQRQKDGEKKGNAYLWLYELASKKSLPTHGSIALRHKDHDPFVHRSGQTNQSQDRN